MRDSASASERRSGSGDSDRDSRGSGSSLRPNGKSGGAGEPGNAGPPQVEIPGQSSREVPDTIRGRSSPSSSPEVPEVPEHLRGPSAPKKSSDGVPGASSSDEPAKLDGPSSGGPASGIWHRTSTDGAIPLNSLPKGDSRQVASIALNRMLTGGVNAGDRSGDHGVLVVIEPRDAQGRTVDAPADVTIALLDPAKEGEAARFARWEFTAEQIALMFRRTAAGQAIHVDAPWPGDPPSHNKLHLFVRYITADGRKLEADQPIEIALPGEKSARWTPAESAARSGSATHDASSPAPSNVPAADNWQRSETPTAHVPSETPHTASRSSSPQRPVWSPERR